VTSIQTNFSFNHRIKHDRSKAQKKQLEVMRRDDG